MTSTEIDHLRDVPRADRTAHPHSEIAPRGVGWRRCRRATSPGRGVRSMSQFYDVIVGSIEAIQHRHSTWPCP